MKRFPKLKTTLAIGAGFTLLLLVMLDVVFDFRKPKLSLPKLRRR
ncbi:MAG: hypothetical protein ACI9OJ_003495 [Myxococcota bacterium]|jgi:hypothetical protein